METAPATQKSHHVRDELCTTRCPYRQGRQLRAVKVYTVAQESRYLLVQGMPAVGAHQELVRLMALYGTVEEYHMLDEYPALEHTEVMWVKFQKIQAARMAKKKLDDYNFFGGTLHICYAPEFETVQDAREKLQERRRAVATRVRKIKAERDEAKPTASTATEDTRSSATPALLPATTESVQPSASDSSSTVSHNSRIPTPSSALPDLTTPPPPLPTDVPHFPQPFSSHHNPPSSGHQHPNMPFSKPSWAPGHHQPPPNFLRHPPPRLPPPGNTHHHLRPPPPHHHPPFPPGQPPPPPPPGPPPPRTPPGHPMAFPNHSIQDYYAHQQGTPLPNHSVDSLGGLASSRDRNNVSATTADKSSKKINKDERTMTVETKKGIETVVVKKYTGSSNTVKFVPRQVARKEPVIKKTGPLPPKPKPKADLVNQELRANAQVLGEVAGPGMPEGVSGNSLTGSQIGDESLEKTAAEIREKVRQFAAIALPPQLKRNRKRKASDMKS